MRADLLALTAPALANLANMGLLKRAQKEVEQGKVVSVTTEPDGTVVGTYDDGVVTRLVPGKGLADSPCTCGATGACRHRIAAVLAYQRAATAAPLPGPPPEDGGREGAGPPPADGKRPWSPGDVDDATLQKTCGASPVARAALAMRRGVLAEVRRPSGGGPEDVHVVHLATSSVRFLVAGDVSWARCDCALRTACEHVVLAILAFRAADARDAAATTLSVELFTEGAASRRLPGALETALEIGGMVLLEGIARLPAATAARFSVARGALEKASLAWPLACLDDIEDQLDAYRRRSARYDADLVASFVAELHARARAGAGGGELPARLVLGADEALDARLDQVRLVGLGARVEADGDRRIIEAFFCDPDSGAILVLRRIVTPDPNTPPPDGPTLARRTAVTGSPFSVVAAGQLVSNAASRRPDRLVAFSTGPLRKTSVFRGSGLASIPPAVRVDDVAAFLDALRARAPRVLRPRLLAENLRVFSIAEVAHVGWDEATQAVLAECVDVQGTPFRLELRHRPVAPGAQQALARLLRSSDLAAVVGDAKKSGTGLHVTPIGVFTDALHVLDFAEPSPEGAADLAGLARIPAAPIEPLADAIARARVTVDEPIHHGLRALPEPWSGRLRNAARGLRDVGLTRAADDLDRLEQAWQAARATGAEPDERAVCEAWASAVIRLEMLAERV